MAKEKRKGEGNPRRENRCWRGREGGGATNTEHSESVSRGTTQAAREEEIDGRATEEKEPRAWRRSDGKR